MYYLNLLAACVLSTAIYLVIIHVQRHSRVKAFARKNGCQPVRTYLRNPWWPPLGLDKHFPTQRATRAGRLPAFMLEEFERHGHTYSQTVGGQYVILTNSPKNVQSICQTRFKDYELGVDRKGNFGPLVEHTLLAQDGQAWMRLRTMLRPHFNRNVDEDFAILELHFQKLLRVLERTADGQKSVNVQSLFWKLITDVSAEAVFGRSMETLEDNETDGSRPKPGSTAELAKAIAITLRTLGERARIMNFYWLIDGLQFRRSCKTCQRFVSRYLQEAKDDSSTAESKRSQSQSFLHSLVLKEDAPEQVMRDQLLTLFLASRDTTASYLSWVLFALARYPEKAAKLRECVVQGLGYKVPDVADVVAMPYVRYFLNEVMRIYPVVPLNGRSASVDTVLPEGGGPDGTSPLVVPRGTKVGFGLFAMQRRKDIFGDDANYFRPERWEGANDTFDGAFVPFISGPRVCLGKNIAVNTVSYFLIRMLQSFEGIERGQDPASISQPRTGPGWPSKETAYGLSDLDTTYDIGLTMAPRDGVWLKLSHSQA